MCVRKKRNKPECTEKTSYLYFFTAFYWSVKNDACIHLLSTEESFFYYCSFNFPLMYSLLNSAHGILRAMYEYILQLDACSLIYEQSYQLLRDDAVLRLLLLPQFTSPDISFRKYHPAISENVRSQLNLLLFLIYPTIFDLKELQATRCVNIMLTEFWRSQKKRTIFYGGEIQNYDLEPMKDAI